MGGYGYEEIWKYSLKWQIDDGYDSIMFKNEWNMKQGWKNISNFEAYNSQIIEIIIAIQ